MSELAAVAAFLEPEHRELAERLLSWTAERIRPLPPAEDDGAARRQARRLLGELGEGGWCRYAVPPDLGGGETVDLRACCVIRDTLAAASPLADAVFALQALGSQPIALAGSAEVRERWLPEVAEGRAMAAFAMTEPEAGSDVGAIRTTARREGEGYRLDGRKTYISNAGIADFYVVFARTGDLEEGTRGLSAFVVPADAPGLLFAGPQVLSEPHPLGEIELAGCRVPAAARLGEEGEGFALGMRTLDRLRATVAAAACGMASRALEEALAHARERRQFGRPLAGFQMTRDKLARMATRVTAARLLTYRAAWEADRGAERVTLESAMAKSYATEAAQKVVDDAVQILGGKGVLASSPVDRLYRAVRALRVYEGATEIQRLVIARELVDRRPSC
ncbi:MAG: acyl-CoA dehydrogenase family protein [Thermoanaerobaculia bacterium]|nr:acyl-CoA dehydrogenase family protein [Thermoanaerobaculia bacterium]